MRVSKLLLAVMVIQFVVACTSKSNFSLAGRWKVTEAVGNNGKHWNGTFDLIQEGGNYRGHIQWAAKDGSQTGTDSIFGKFDVATRVLTMSSVTISGNIESVKYIMDVSEDGNTMTGVWTGSSDGTVENPGRWSAVRE